MCFTDMGLSEGKTSVRYGKPGNPNIMLVKFSGTLSGLQEAERLHNVFSEKKRGRAELQEIDHAGIGCNEVVVQNSEEKIEDALVKFNGSLCGLPDAERLSSVFPENKHGRAELQVTGAGIKCNEEVSQKPADKIEDALVKSNGTLPGLEDAERPHNVFSEKKHGRAELQETNAGSGCNEEVAQKPEDKMEDALVKFNVTHSGLQEAEKPHNVLTKKKRGIGGNKVVVQRPEDKIKDALYGYLGIVEDFDKLNYDIRRHCVAKSKKEILASMDTDT